MKIKQNLEIIKNISTIDIEFNRRLVSIGYQLFSNNREMDESVYNEEIDNFVKSLQEIQRSVATILTMVVKTSLVNKDPIDSIPIENLFNSTEKNNDK